MLPYKKFTALLWLLIGVTACEPWEVPCSNCRPFTDSRSVFIGTNYQRQIFFSLLEETPSDTIYNSDYDLIVFQDKQTSIMLNSSRAASAYLTSASTFEQAPAFDASLAQYDAASWQKDSLALGAIQNDRLFYMFSGFSEENDSLPTFLIQSKINQDSIHFRFNSNLDNTIRTLDLALANSSGHLYINLLNPKKNKFIPLSSWDLSFGRYMDIVPSIFDSSEVAPYLLTGISTNPFVQSQILNQATFQSIQAETIDAEKWSDKKNSIGHAWKVYQSDQGLYIINPHHKNFLIQDWKGILWKLEIISFYTSMGEKGNLEIRTSIL